MIVSWPSDDRGLSPDPYPPSLPGQHQVGESVRGVDARTEAIGLEADLS
jgi:hypothetical protein